MDAGTLLVCIAQRAGLRCNEQTRPIMVTRYGEHCCSHAAHRAMHLVTTANARPSGAFSQTHNFRQ